MYPKRLRRPSKLDPHSDYIRERLEAARPHGIPSSVLHREIRERGYTGSDRLLRRFMATLRPASAPEPLIRFETGPGQQMQVDWGVFRRGKALLSALVATLGWSRCAYVEFVTDECFDTLKCCHEHAFEYFQGVPRELLYDKCAPSSSSATPTATACYGQSTSLIRPFLIGRCLPNRPTKARQSTDNIN